MMLIPMTKSLLEIEAARLYLELWGGHPHTTNRRVTINGRTTYPIEVPSEDQCTHAYRDIPLKLTDLVQGPNAVQFAVDGDHTFWGHFIVEEAAIDVLLPQTTAEWHSESSEPMRAPRVSVDTSQPEAFLFSLDVDPKAMPKIARVHYFAHYDGFDENGDGVTRDWHGMTKQKEPMGHLGSADQAPFSIRWDTSMLQAQEGVRAQALIEFVGSPQLRSAEERLRALGHRYWNAEGSYYQTDPTRELTISHPDGVYVDYVPCQNVSVPFWSRANRKRSCEFAVDQETSRIDRAQLSVAVWDGGAGEVEDYFTFNGHALRVAADGAHDVIYSTVSIDPEWILSGGNRIELLSDTEHHGIEVLYPGPMLTIRYID